VKFSHLAVDEFIRAGLPKTTAEFLANKTHPIPNLDILVSPVGTFFEFRPPADATDVIALWEENADPTCMWQRNGVTEFACMYHDDPGHHVVTTSLQRLLAELFMRYHELESLDSDNPDKLRDLMVRMGSYIGFRGAERLFDMLEAYEDEEPFDAQLDALIRELDG
jgi:hypothetical protein